MRGVRVIVVPAVLLLAGTILDDGSAQPSRATIAKHYTPADRISGRYQYVPFEVPPGTARLRIAYQYDRNNGENVVDLGLFEPGLLDLGTSAFRGYSGGARPGIDLSADSATPGYKRGPIPPGRWHVLLGLYKVRAEGVDVSLDIETNPGAAPVASVAPVHRTAPDAPVAPVAPGWFTGALHTHTVHSDGSVTPVDLLHKTRALGFDFVVITDHNNTTHRADLAQRAAAAERPLWIAGEEVTTPSGHASVWGLDDGEWVDFRVRAEDRKIGELVSSAHRFGALFSVNHPASECVGCSWEHDIPADVDAIEISNGRHGEVAKALALWDSLLGSGRRITGVGSSDWHAAPNPVDVANSRVFAEALTEKAILEGIRAGHVIVVNGAKHQTPDVVVRSGGRSARVGDSLTLAPSSSIAVDVRADSLPGGRLIVVRNGARDAAVPLDSRGAARIETRVTPGYVRFELSAADGTLVAITNPVHLVRP